ncbi:MAG: polysaccharide deacetylase family protein, partial [Methyloceanibacter sp.]
AADPLVTIGAHTKGHYAIAKLSPEKAREELEGSADRLENELGMRPAHFSFPFGDVSSARAAVTTRKGVLFPAHRRYATALPRVSLNDEYQSLTYTQLYLSGAPFALVNHFQQVDAA